MYLCGDFLLINVFLVDDHELVRSGIRRILEDVRGIKVVGEVSCGEDAVQFCRDNQPDVVLMDMNMPGIGGLEATRKILRKNPDIKIIVLTINIKIDYVEMLFDSKKVEGYLDKNLDIQTLDFAIKQVLSGKTYLAPELKATIERGRWYILSERQRQVVELLTKGLAKKQVGDHLYISANTVDAHVKNLFKLFQVNTTQELVAKYVQYISLSTENPDEISSFKKVNLGQKNRDST